MINNIMDEHLYLQEIITKKIKDDAKNEFSKFFEFIFNNIKEGISILDTNLNIIGINNVLMSWYTTKKSFIGEKCYKIYHNRNKPCNNCPTLKAISSKKTMVGLIHYSEPNSEGWHEIYSFPLYNEDQKIIAIIEYVDDITKREKYKKVADDLKKRLRFQSQTLSDQEIALKVLLNQSKKTEKSISDNIIFNIYNQIKPIIENLLKKIKDKEVLKLIRLLETALYTITSPFIKNISAATYNFTPSEVKVANLVRIGKTNKEIAGILCVSEKTICFHRINIRKKLNLSNGKVNLQTYLCNL